MACLNFQPRQRLYHAVVMRMVLSIVALSVLAMIVLVCLQGPWRDTSRSDHGALAATAIAQGIERTVIGGGSVQQLTQQLTDITSQPNIAFAAVTVDGQRILAQSVMDQEAWDRARVTATDPSSADRSWFSLLPLNTDSTRTVALSPTVATRLAGAGSHVELVVGLRDVHRTHMMADSVVAWGVAMLLVLLIAVPLMRRWIQRQMTILNELLIAIRRLVEGASPKAIAVTDNGEMGYLALAFNDMASRLLANKKSLVDANKVLEDRVRQRTAALQEASERMHSMAHSDALTGLANRRALTAELARRFERARHGDEEMVCMAIDLDHFKYVNDQFGHAAGDKLLQLASTVLKENTRPTDLVARMGGDEFVVLLHLEDVKVAEKIAHRMLGDFKHRVIEELALQESGPIPSLSVGIAARKLHQIQTDEHLLSRADTALYAAKNRGNGCVALHDNQQAA